VGSDGTYFIADGYANTRVVKYDKNDNYVMAWGEKGEGTAQKPETRPGYFNSVHGIAVDPVGASSVTSTIATTGASRCSTRTASSCACGASARRRPTCI
jgi:hypothetical protein